MQRDRGYNLLIHFGRIRRFGLGDANHYFGIINNVLLCASTDASPKPSFM
jgi:hypothetical protein